MNTVQILKDARALIADEKNWTRGEYARNARGYWRGVLSEDSVCFCSIGAMARSAKTTPREIETCDKILQIFSADGLRRVSDLVDFNDGHTHAEVLALFDRAIARAESEAVQ